MIEAGLGKLCFLDPLSDDTALSVFCYRCIPV